MGEILDEVEPVAVDERAFRDALGRFASGVCVVTARHDDGRPVGVTISAFASLSLTPPLVLFCLGKATTHIETYRRSRAFAVNLLAEEQVRLSELFATQGADKFADTAGREGRNGCFLLDGCLAGLECTRVAAHDGGDHVILVGAVERIIVGQAARPLLRFRGRYARLGDAC
jgi:flavin reductase (DIM6/NTAB) family NADH-FMN oxidoreductase RutF